jgi:hypothetical protein
VAVAGPLPQPQEPGPDFLSTPTLLPFFSLTPEQDGTPEPEVTGQSAGQDPTPEITIPNPGSLNLPPILYYTQGGDTLPVVAVRFGVSPEEITSPEPIPETAIIDPDQLLIIPQRLANTTTSQRVLPDSELVYSPSATDFDVRAYVQDAGGYLNSYREYLAATENTIGAEVVGRVATENSINPRLLLALLEYQSNWVTGQPENFSQRDYPLGEVDLKRRGLFKQLAWAVNQLSIGYYGWREGLLTELTFKDGTTARLSPELNSGTVALQYYFAQLYDAPTWVAAMDPASGFPALYERMFGNPWVRALVVEPLFPRGLEQPPMILPFLPGHLWAYTGGPHGAWERDGARAAIDFAPGSSEPGCVKSNKVTVAAATGLVVRSGNGIVVIDLDGDGLEQTGWALLYLHVSNNGRNPMAPAGTWVETGDYLGYPSCEGGVATGTHIHLARKYNGEWIPADGPLPFNLDGWIAHAGSKPYEGTLTRDGEIVIASPLSTYETRITREVSIP